MSHYVSLLELQQKIIPEHLYEDPMGFSLALLIAKEKYFPGLLCCLNQDIPDYVCPFQPNEFKIHYSSIPQGFIIQIIMPKPLETLYSRSVYLCHNLDTKESIYFTVELTEKGNYLICSIPNIKQLVIHEYAPETFEEEFLVIKDLFDHKAELDEDLQKCMEHIRKQAKDNLSSNSKVIGVPNPQDKTEQYSLLLRRAQLDLSLKEKDNMY